MPPERNQTGRPPETGLPAPERDPADDRRGTERPGTSPEPADGPQASTVGDGPEPRATRTGPETEPSGREPETSERPSEGEGRNNEPGERSTTDNAASPSEETDQGQGVSEPHGGNDRNGRKAEQQEVADNGDGNSTPGRDSSETDDVGRHGGEQAPQDRQTTEVEEPRRFQGRITIHVDRDGKPLPLSRDAALDIPDRGEPRRPEDDPASRDYRSNPDNPSRGRDSLRRFLNKASDAKDATNKFSEPAEHNLGRIKPTGELCGARPTNDEFKPTNKDIKAGDALIGAVGTAIVLTQVVRHGIKLVQQTRRTENADN